jgi:hypothetical protein
MLFRVVWNAGRWTVQKCSNPKQKNGAISGSHLICVCCLVGPAEMSKHNFQCHLYTPESSLPLIKAAGSLSPRYTFYTL